MSGNDVATFQNCPVTTHGSGVFCVTVLGPSDGVDQSVLIPAPDSPKLNFDDVVKKLPGCFVDQTTRWYAKVTYLAYNTKTNRLETNGSVELHAKHGKSASDVKLHLHHPTTGALMTGVTPVASGIVEIDQAHTDAVQQNAEQRYEIVNSPKFTNELAMNERRNAKRLSNFIHWFITGLCDTAIHIVIYGQPSINAFLGSKKKTMHDWWRSATMLAEVLFVSPGSKKVYSDAELQSLGVSAIALLVGPYTIPPDAIDGRNTKWATYNENGDCDKDALTAAAIYTMLRCSADDFDCGHLLGNRIVSHWKQCWGAAVMMHVTATSETALGQDSAPEGHRQRITCGPEMGHCIWGVLPQATGGIINPTMSGEDLAKAYKNVQDTKDAYILLGEATRPTTANPFVVAQTADGAGMFRDHYPNLKYGAPGAGGWGEIKLLDETQYPHLMQMYTAGGCCFFKASGEGFPSVCEALRGNKSVELEDMTTLLPPEGLKTKDSVWKKGTKFEPHRERQDISEITFQNDFVAEIPVNARLCNPRNTTFKQMTNPNVITIGAAKFGVVSPSLLEIPEKKKTAYDWGRSKL